MHFCILQDSVATCFCGVMYYMSFAGKLDLLPAVKELFEID